MTFIRKQEITYRLMGKRDLFSIVRGLDVMVAVEAAKVVATVTGEIVRPDDIEIMAIIEFDQDEHGNRVGAEHTIYRAEETS